jgi:hypothetical protein
MRSESCNTIFSLLDKQNKVRLAAMEKSWREEPLPCWRRGNSGWSSRSIWLRITRNRICFKDIDLYLKTKNSPQVSCRELKDVPTHQRDLDLMKRASPDLGFSLSDLKSCESIFSSYGGWKEMRFVWIERTQRDLQLLFRSQSK